MQMQQSDVDPVSGKLLLWGSKGRVPKACPDQHRIPAQIPPPHFSPNPAAGIHQKYRHRTPVKFLPLSSSKNPKPKSCQRIQAKIQPPDSSPQIPPSRFDPKSCHRIPVKISGADSKQNPANGFQPKSRHQTPGQSLPLDCSQTPTMARSLAKSRHRIPEKIPPPNSNQNHATRVKP